jgi:23S rRNA G2445 N2-methylase RlmL
MKTLNQSHYQYFASCPKGIEECLKLEFQKMGLKQLTLHRGGIAFSGGVDSFIEPLLSSRVASRIFMQIAKGSFKTTKELERFLSGIEWEKFLHFKQTFRFRVVWDASLNTELKNSLYWAQKSKDALVDRLRAKFNQRPDVDTKNPETDFLIRIDKDKNITVLVDLCGEPLHQRGYRDSNHQAPLKENLAAAIIMLTDWKPSSPLLDPMCGSGTLLIEAFLYKYNISPQVLNLLNRKSKSWAFERFYYLRPFKEITETFSFLKDKFISSYQATRGLVRKEKAPQFFANDLKGFNVQICKKQFSLYGATNLLSDSASDALSLKKTDFVEEDKELTIITNPPYGERLGDISELENFYYDFGEVLKNNFKNTSAFILCGEPALRKKIRLKTKSKKEIFNGPIECRILEYQLF